MGMGKHGAETSSWEVDKKCAWGFESLYRDKLKRNEENCLYIINTI